MFYAERKGFCNEGKDTQNSNSGRADRGILLTGRVGCRGTTWRLIRPYGV